MRSIRQKSISAEKRDDNEWQNWAESVRVEVKWR